MKQTYIKIQAIFLALMILVVSNSYAITSHFCGSQLVAVSYFGGAAACDMAPSDDDCKDEQSIKKDCCKDITEILEPDVLDKTAQVKFSKKEVTFLTYFTISFISLFNDSLKEGEILLDLPPPDIISNKQVLYQSFLI
ncbi:MAG: hypothetical protein JXQ93_07950 [Flavobacteriaceae bacterium]